tara:strand:+ start:944 stop:1108 length:165 start_codon:yes stop_codon:yes gene_type:complete
MEVSSRLVVTTIFVVCSGLMKYSTGLERKLKLSKRSLLGQMEHDVYIHSLGEVG